ncbi:MAG: tRNA pseudouridine(55) synthase TruB [Clostridiales bacterium]|nr:tRNA pseudouridine(55) synthase TruB [Clostridiales bacterium]
MMDGILNVYKEKGYTSHDVVARLRGILHMKKIGHTGTLDPEAEGVLPVCLGQATKLCDLLTDKSKTYRAVLLLGRETDTQDTTGRTIRECPVEVQEAQVCAVIAGFVGKYMQIPPMYSARKVNGKKLYELARAGKEVAREAREVEISDIQIDEIALPRVTMTVSCSKGTYIRTLCHDIGETLGCGGCMEYLLRTRVGSFALADSLRLDAIEALRDSGDLERHILAVDAAFADLPRLTVRPQGDKLVNNGNPFAPELADMVTDAVLTGALEASYDGNLWPRAARVYDSCGRFIGIYDYEAGKRRYKPRKVFLGGNQVCGRSQGQESLK